jgi:hypothetical protein
MDRALTWAKRAPPSTPALAVAGRRQGKKKAAIAGEADRGQGRGKERRTTIGLDSWPFEVKEKFLL